MTTLETTIDFDEALADCANIDAADAATVGSTFLTFDIETGPLPLAELEPLIPSFDPGEPPGEFDPSAVKFGNLKDPVKRAALVEEKRAKHNEEVRNWKQTVAKKREEHRDKFFAGAALSAITGRILALGLSGRGANGVNHDDACSLLTAETESEEKQLLHDFWSTFEAAEDSNRTLVGHNIRKFDLPFLIQRSWLLGVRLPVNVFDGGRWSTLFADTMHIWGCHSNHEYISLNALARALKVGEKTGKGEDFSQLFLTERPRALAYLRDDLDLTRRVAVRLGVR